MILTVVIEDFPEEMLEKLFLANRKVHRLIKKTDDLHLNWEQMIEIAPADASILLGHLFSFHYEQEINRLNNGT